MLCTKALGWRGASVVQEMLYPVAVGLFSPFAISQPVNGEGNAVNQVLPRLSDSYFFVVHVLRTPKCMTWQRKAVL